MTNEEMIQDLKQFIQVTVRQEVASLAQEVDGLSKRMATRFDQVDIRFDHLDEKVDLIQGAIAETVATIEVKQQEHDQRLRRLERRAA